MKGDTVTCLIQVEVKKKKSLPNRKHYLEIIQPASLSAHTSTRPIPSPLVWTHTNAHIFRRVLALTHIYTFTNKDREALKSLNVGRGQNKSWILYLGVAIMSYWCSFLSVFT